MGGLSAQVFAHSGSARGGVFAVYGLTMVAMVLNNIGGGSTNWTWLGLEG
ncbi:hypothetical protein K8M07_03515 [Schnuerera sp. xch1]|nr:hypothetical protein [Schnuerera sp. xch1]MBZ2174311.1 hypothetical protein [Schnuerera sp. xch1]